MGERELYAAGEWALVLVAAEQAQGGGDAWRDALEDGVTRTFTKELRWNQAYHRLALGL